MLGPALVAASGMLAACARPDTAAAPARAAADAPTKFLRESLRFMVWFLLVTAEGVRRRRDVAGFGGSRAAVRAGDQRRRKVAIGEPERALGLDRRAGRGDLLARFGQQREDIDLHRIVAQQHLVRDQLA